MATELWKKAFEKLKFPDKELSPDTLENNNQTISSQGELAYERSNEITGIEKFQIEEEKNCEPQRDKLSKEKTTTLILPVADTNEKKETEESDKKTKGTIPKQKKMHNQKTSNKGGEKSKKASHHSEKILTSKEMELLRIMKQSGVFRRVKAVRNNDFNCRNTGTHRNEKPVLAAHKSEFNSSLDNVDDSDYEDNTPLTGLVSADRYTQADRMASHPIILSEIWDDEEIW